MSYSHLDLENKWQTKWEHDHVFQSKLDRSKPKFYALDMFPYPSGAGLHVGHLASYTPTDIVSRYKRAKGFNVLHPIGYDAFGLPAEQYAIQTGIHPAVTTNKAIENFRRQLKSFGFSFDWERELSTCDATYYKWTQFIFLKLYERGLAYQKDAPVNWCPELRTVLANEEVVDGKSERGGHPVIRVKMKQWMLKITDYAERLLKDLDKLDWPEPTKEAQRNWIGKSIGATMQFQVASSASDSKIASSATLEVFTTRPDTIFGATFLVIAPEHPLVKKITTQEQNKAVENYGLETSKKSDMDRKVATVKTGVFTGAFAVHPFLKTNIPIWIADYVLMDYGTGAIMAVPGHDERDYEFAKKFKLPILRVLNSDTELPFTGDGALINSDFLNGLNQSAAISKMIEIVESQKLGTATVQYKLRDWLFSRQRYWGEPIPVVHLKDGSTKGLSLNELPLTLPEVADYEPSSKGEPPLARVTDFMSHPDGLRDANTMPGSAGSSWYFLRYTDPKNSTEPFSKEAEKYWMPVDLYVGGAEHTVGHLLYSRFWQKVLFDCGLATHDEPFQKLAHQGVVMGPDGQRMSKSRGNVVNPDDVRSEYGADASRAYISFLGPFDKDKPWDTKGIDGVRRFLDRVWRLAFNEDEKTQATKVHAEDVALPPELEKLLHKTIKKVGDDIEGLNFNTAISAMMILVNEVYKQNLRPKKLVLTLSQLLMPFAPHVAEEIWSQLGGQGYVSLAPWPAYDPNLILDDKIEMGVQVNGKSRGSIVISLQTSEAEAMNLAKSINSVANAIGSMAIAKVIYKPGKILNIIAK
jgi:leucyl-tRNA synthetase